MKNYMPIVITLQSRASYVAHYDLIVINSLSLPF